MNVSSKAGPGGWSAVAKVGGAAGVLLAGILLFAAIVAAQEKAFDLDSFFRKVFLTRELRTKSFGPMRWMEGGESFSTLEPSESVKGATDVVRYGTATNKREVLLAAADLKVAGA